MPGESLLPRLQAFSLDAGRVSRLEALVEGEAALEEARQADLFEQYVKMVRGVAEGHPVILVLDDLQWADAGSIDLLFHLGRRLAGSRILVVGVYRPDEVALGRGGARHPLEPVINELHRAFGEIEVDLGQTEGRRFVGAFVDSELNRLGAGFRHYR